MSGERPKEKVIVFICGWHAHSSLDEAGRRKLVQSSVVVPIRLSCIGRISSGLILKAYQGGAAGVCLLGCPENECRYGTGNQQAREVCEETRQMLDLMGYNPDTLLFSQLPAGEGKGYLEIVDQLLEIIAEQGKKP